MNIVNSKIKRFKYGDLLNKCLANILKKENISGEGTINLILVSKRKMESLYKKHKNKSKVTDILSFPSEWKYLKTLTNRYDFGDIYMCKWKIKNQSKLYKHTLEREWGYIFTHGVLHLLGYDHVIKTDETIMNKKTEDIMNKLKLSR